MKYTGNIKAILDVIADCEGADYNTWFGGSKFVLNGLHPSWSPNLYKGKKVSASGRYQINNATWKEFGTGLKFDKEGQDECAVRIIKHENAYNDILNGYIESGLKKIAERWASLPNSKTNQPEKSMAYCLKKFKEHGGIAMVKIDGIYQLPETNIIDNLKKKSMINKVLEFLKKNWILIAIAAGLILVYKLFFGKRKAF